jgi:hypothetical protein
MIKGMCWHPVDSKGDVEQYNLFKRLDYEPFVKSTVSKVFWSKGDSATVLKGLIASFPS